MIEWKFLHKKFETKIQIWKSPSVLSLFFPRISKAIILFITVKERMKYYTSSRPSHSSVKGLTSVSSLVAQQVNGSVNPLMLGGNKKVTHT